MLVTSAEGEGSEDGGFLINVFSLPEGRLERGFPLRHEGNPSARPSPDAGFGGFPNPNGIAVTAAHGGLVFTANGGTDDVAVLRLQALLDGEPDAEIARVAVPSGPFGLALNAAGTLLAVANRESVRTGVEGNTVSIIDTGKHEIVATVLVGTDDPAIPSRPTGVAFSPDGSILFVTCMRTGTLSCVHVAEALAGGRAGWRRVQLEAPRGVLVTPDGRFVVVTGGFRGEPRSGALWILDAETLAEMGRVSGVGNEPYFLEAFAIPKQ
jgi:DNA-binding beta-propeller fold protein YncE